jgi:HPt (histidine-containing phosphotransfer) domain-containing protein
MNEVDAKLEDLRKRFLKRSAEDLKAIEAAIASPASIDRTRLRTTVHRLSGAAGTFGYPKLSEIAGAADDALMGFQGDVEEILDRLYEELRRTLANPKARR